MSNLEFLSSAGCLILHEFLNRSECEQLLIEAHAAGLVQARLVNKNGEVRVDQAYRQTKSAQISASTISSLRDRLLTLMPRIEAHFGTKLVGCEAPQLLVYRKGDFFRAHRDFTDGEENNFPRRKVSVVVFLNDQGTSIDKSDYCGGSLTLYGIINKPGWEEIGFPAAGEVGLLVAFASGTVHEVTPVTKGTRHTIVSWYF